MKRNRDVWHSRTNTHSMWRSHKIHTSHVPLRTSTHVMRHAELERDGRWTSFQLDLGLARVSAALRRLSYPQPLLRDHCSHDPAFRSQHGHSSHMRLVYCSSTSSSRSSIARVPSAQMPQLCQVLHSYILRIDWHVTT